MSYVLRYFASFNLLNPKSSLHNTITNFLQYYVYQCDLVKGIEDLRTPLDVAIKLEKDVRGTISGFNMPCFVVDLPGGGGKRHVATYESYDEKTGVYMYKAPGLAATNLEKATREYFYHDPKPMTEQELIALREEKRRQRVLEWSTPKEQKPEAKPACGSGCGAIDFGAFKPKPKPAVVLEAKKEGEALPSMPYGWASSGSPNPSSISAYAYGPQ
jgi:hypothetical protein